MPPLKFFANVPLQGEHFRALFRRSGKELMKVFADGLLDKVFELLSKLEHASALNFGSEHRYLRDIGRLWKFVV